MAKGSKNAISPTRVENYPEWYQQVIKAADLAENSPVRGCMVIKPWGYALWENIQKVLDGMFKATGHTNAYFPLFIPISYLEKEAAHVDGFAKECAVVTHSRLVPDGEGGLMPASPLEEPYIVRPTSETIIGEMYAKWVQSYRDLPLLINQWANVVRWEMRTRLFLRTAEFLWQEGHTVHATAEEAIEETERMLGVYADFAENWMAMPVICGEKTPAERFPGADNTLCIEAMMQDNKALQAGTSHFLGQNFAKASGIKFSDEDGQEKLAWTTSWGVSTRLVGAMIMTHSDDDGLRLPPKLAPSQIVILPILNKEETREEVLAYCEALAKELRGIRYHEEYIRVELDKRDMRGGEKTWGWIKKGVPLRVEIGPRDIANGNVFVGRRDTGEKAGMSRDEFVANICETLDSIQANMLNAAKAYRTAATRVIHTKEEFYEYFAKDNGGFALAHYNGSAEIEDQISKELKVTIRCIPHAGQVDYADEQAMEPGTCIFTGEPSKQRVVWAKAY